MQSFLRAPNVLCLQFCVHWRKLELEGATGADESRHYFDFFRAVNGAIEDLLLQSQPEMACPAITSILDATESAPRFVAEVLAHRFFEATVPSKTAIASAMSRPHLERDPFVLSLKVASCLRLLWELPNRRTFVLYSIYALCEECNDTEKSQVLVSKLLWAIVGPLPAIVEELAAGNLSFTSSSRPCHPSRKLIDLFLAALEAIDPLGTPLLLHRLESYGAPCCRRLGAAVRDMIAARASTERDYPRLRDIAAQVLVLGGRA